MAVGFTVGFYYYSIGSADFLHSFFSTVAVNLEDGKWGSRFPVLMNELYQGKLPVEKNDTAIKELTLIRDELKNYSPDKVIWDIEDLSKQPPWGNSKIEKYKKNHPDIEKIIFLICDEFEAYFELGELTNKGFRGNVHQWFFDSRFMNVLKNTSVDIVIWFTPYKILERDGIDFPEVVVVNPRLIDNSKLIEYDKEHMFDVTRVQRVI